MAEQFNYPGASQVPSGKSFSEMKQFLDTHEDLKIDPIFRAMVSGMSESIEAMTNQAVKEGAENIEQVLSYRRAPYEFDSGVLEHECLPHLVYAITYLDGYNSDTVETDTAGHLRAWNAIADISDAVVNVGIDSPGVFPEEPTPEVIAAYFTALQVRDDFVSTFLTPLGIGVELRPVFEDEDISYEFKCIQQPYLVMTTGEKTIRVLLAPCATYMPDWYRLINNFRTAAASYLEDARIAMDSNTLSDSDYTATEEEVEDDEE